MMGADRAGGLSPWELNIDGPLLRLEPPRPTQQGSAAREERRIVAVSGIAGAGLLGLSFSRQPGSREFYVLTVGVAGTLTAGTVLSQARPPVRSQGHGAPSGPVTGHVGTRRGRRVRSLLRCRSSGPSHTVAGASRQPSPGLRARRLDPFGVAHHRSQRDSRGDVLPGRPVVRRGGLESHHQDHPGIHSGDRGHAQPGTGPRRHSHQPALRLPASGDGRHPRADHHPPDLVDADASLPATPISSIRSVRSKCASIQLTRGGGLRTRRSPPRARNSERAARTMGCRVRRGQPGSGWRTGVNAPKRRRGAVR